MECTFSSQKSPSEPIEDRSDTEFFINKMCVFFCECRSGFQPACCTATPMPCSLLYLVLSLFFSVARSLRLPFMLYKFKRRSYAELAATGKY